MPVPIIAAPINAAIKASKNKSGLAHQVFEPTQGLSDRYQALSDANPYANVNYKQSWWQKFLSGLGFRTNYDAYLEGMNLQAQEYDTAVLQKQADEAYNDPSAQVARLRSAGINPDLSGNVSSGESSALQDDGNPPVPPQADDLQMITGFAGAVLQGVQAAVGLAGSFQQLSAQKLENNSKLTSFAEDAILHVLPEVYEDSSGEGWKSVDNYYPKLKQLYGPLMNKRQFRKFVGLANNFANGLSTSSKRWSLNKGRADSRKGFYRAVSGEDYSEQDEVMRLVSGELSNLAITLFKERTDADIKTALNDQDEQTFVRPKKIYNDTQYETYRDGKAEALEHNRGLKLDNDIKDEELKMRRYRYELRSSFDSILNGLKDLEDDGNSFAPLVRAVLSAIIIKQLGD